MRVYLSGGPDRSRSWGGLANTKAEAKKLIRQTAPGVNFVTSGKSDYIVMPDSVSSPSMTALKTACQNTKIMGLTPFMRILRSQQQRKSTRRGSRRARSRKRSVRRC